MLLPVRKFIKVAVGCVLFLASSLSTGACKMESRKSMLNSPQPLFGMNVSTYINGQQIYSNDPMKRTRRKGTKRRRTRVRGRTRTRRKTRRKYF